MNTFQTLFDGQKALFASYVTRSRAWRVEQLDRMGRMIKENEAALQEAIAHDFKTASQEYIFETAATFLETEYQKSELETWMAPSEAPVPKALARTGHKGVVYRDRYGVVLVVGPFNGRLLPNAPLANYPPWRSASAPPALLRHAKLFLEGGEGTHSQHRSCRLHHPSCPASAEPAYKVSFKPSNDL